MKEELQYGFFQKIIWCINKTDKVDYLIAKIFRRRKYSKIKDIQVPVYSKIKDIHQSLRIALQSKFIYSTQQQN